MLRKPVFRSALMTITFIARGCHACLKEMMMRLIKRPRFALFLVPLFVLTACATQQTISDVWREDREVYAETDTRPTEVFSSANIASVSVMRFDAKSVKTIGGEIIDYIALGNNFTDDLIKGFYSYRKIKVAVGEYEDTIMETDYIERKSGDLDLRSAHTTRTVTFKAVPFKKIDAILSGRIEKFDEAPDAFERSYIEVTFRLVGTYDGEVFWITRMRGFYKDVIRVMVETISTGAYKEPVTTEEEEEEDTSDTP